MNIRSRIQVASAVQAHTMSVASIQVVAPEMVSPSETSSVINSARNVVISELKVAMSRDVFVADLLDQRLEHGGQHHEDDEREDERRTVERHVVAEHDRCHDQADRSAEQRNSNADEQSNHEVLPRTK